MVRYMRSYSFRRMFKKYVSSSVILILATVFALIIANSGWGEGYARFWNQPVTLSVGKLNLFSHGGETLTVMGFINDFLMAIFFFSVGLEIKREILVGELSSLQKAMLPVIGAIGGMIVPVLIFWMVCAGDEQALQGVAIPMATDIAFSLGVLALFNKRVPLSLKVFLATLAVADDLGGILVIALFYTSDFHAGYLFYTLGLILVLVLGNLRGIRSKLFYIVFGILIWYTILNSGIHATIAGVIVAFCIPATLRKTPSFFIERIRRRINEFPEFCVGPSCKTVILTDEQIGALKSIENASDHVISPLQDMEDSLHPFINYIVIPVFAFANAGVTIEGITFDHMFTGVGLGVFLGLVVGKFVGVFSFSWLAIKTGLVQMPTNCDMKSFASVCALTGIGFTVALFIAELSYDGMTEQAQLLLNNAKMGIICGSLVSSLISLVLLHKTLPASVTNN